ncbi:hypothetical protein GQ43DRAFT_436821 [Delitschia confertaspora ATCC 74209]|uniref:Cell wall mannoprotein PIR1-like C-terminal domain-containing protein n=1 Tax=Delitschia confertaspora ATCC 74209 TaxID=1513339 RepID=A0A9P4JUA0_9PLEO|nr:hypothetical protein GQ43DRAFT_436821 [Delitschia confertaspora ATCC 74209]
MFSGTLVTLALASALLSPVSAIISDDLPMIGIAPDESAPPGCVTSYDGVLSLLIGHVNDTTIATKVTLKDGVLLDSFDRVGCVVANWQFQFDGPTPQAGAIYTGGYSKCENDTMALGGSTDFWRCNSGTFDNLYFRKIASYCEPLKIIIKPEVTSSSSSEVASSTVEVVPSTSIKTVATITSTSSLPTFTSTSSAANGTSSTAFTSSSGVPSITTISGPASSVAATGTSSSSTGAAVATGVPVPGLLVAAVGLWFL